MGCTGAVRHKLLMLIAPFLRRWNYARVLEQVCRPCCHQLATSVGLTCIRSCEPRIWASVQKEGMSFWDVHPHIFQS